MKPNGYQVASFILAHYRRDKPDDLSTQPSAYETELARKLIGKLKPMETLIKINDQSTRYH